MFEATREYLKKVGMPSGDLFDMPSSTARFADGGAFRIECPTVNSAEAVEALLNTATKAGIVINRVTETYGMFRHTRQEIKEMCRLCNEYGAELLMSVGPRAPYDTGATVLSPQGVRISYRLRGMEQVLRAVEDIKRGYDLGVRGFLIYDEGMLWLVGQMRKDGALPKEIVFGFGAPGPLQSVLVQVAGEPGRGQHQPGARSANPDAGRAASGSPGAVGRPYGQPARIRRFYPRI
jgi:hypothetical protein